MTKTIKYTLLRNHIGNYLATWTEPVGCKVDWLVSTTPWNAKNFEGSPNELSTTLRHFKEPGWTVVRGTLKWTERKTE